MNGTTMPPPAAAPGAVPAMTSGAGQHPPLPLSLSPSPSFVNSFRVAAVADRLASHVLQPQPVSQHDAMEFFHLCISLARGIDYAVANNEVPNTIRDLPSLMKQVCQRKSDPSLRAAIAVLMLSVKNACKIGWFSSEERKEIFVLANETASGFSCPGDTIPGPSNLNSSVSTIMASLIAYGLGPKVIILSILNFWFWFYPQMKMGQILATLDVKPGYDAFMIDFHILKSTKYSPQEKIRLFVAQTDNIETSACIISPQQANFLINGKGVNDRTNVSMDAGPQLPSNVTSMLKFGTNLLQLVGQFNGHYTVVVAFMSIASSLEIPVLQDYLQSGITIQDSAMHGESRLLNVVVALSRNVALYPPPFRILFCAPFHSSRAKFIYVLTGSLSYSYTRIRTPVKGHSCKHLQCFDFSNFVEINSRRPSWRCPHCNQYVCYTDIRVDQNMVKASGCKITVLREVGENVTDVIISADGSWRAVFESDDNGDTHNNTSSRNKERSEQQESTDCMNCDPVVLDLTADDEDMDAATADEIEDTKPPLLSNLQSQNVGVNRNVDIHSEINFRFTGLRSNGPAAISGVSDARNDGGISEPTFANQMTSPILTDAISPALDRGADLTTSVMQGQYSTPGNLQLQQSQFLDSTVNNEYGRFSLLNRNVNRTPIAVQALPAAFQTPSPQQRPGTSFNSLTPNGSSISSQAALSTANGYRPTTSDIERQLQQRQQQLLYSRSQMNTLMRPDMASSSSLQYHSAAQVVGLPASGTLPDTNQVSSGLSSENQNLHQQQAVNLRRPQFRSQSPSSINVSSPFSRSSIPQGGAQPGVGHTAGLRSSQNARVMLGAQRAAGLATQLVRQASTVSPQVPTSRTGSSYQVHTDGVRVPAGEQRVNIEGGVQAIRADNVVDLTSEQNWRPTGRMRGSLSGRAYSEALSQFMIQQSTQQAQPARAQPNPTPSQPSVPPGLHPSVPPGLQAFIGNSRSAHVPQPQNNPNTEPANMNGGSGTLPDRSLGTR
ncbi:hypothetical protein EZV62_023102 [Acer yangbiense]|uniref:SP-RING-type domain-containing protein n=1 Tax=Acer yangbiense TaxID=1000413 RepID=A0A5C7H0L0_9ROSI|nr:hypothetical protein EZV62_023102 [Acer yangbiense]